VVIATPGKAARGIHQIVVTGRVVTPSMRANTVSGRRLQGQVHVLADLG